MTPKALEVAALALPGATLSIQWGDERIYKVGGKMFAGTDGAGASLSIKVSDIAFEVLVETGRARPARYLARAKWVTFADVATLDDEEVESLLASAHALVGAKLTRKARAELGI